MSSQELTFRRGKVSRNELELPTLHFVVMDQWVDVIGERALFAWLKMYTWCKRDEETDKNQWDEARIPTSFNQIIKRLGVGINVKISMYTFDCLRMYSLVQRLDINFVLLIDY